MTIILVCALYTGVSNVTLAIPSPPAPHYSRQECSAFRTVKEAALARHHREQEQIITDTRLLFQEESFRGDTYYRIDLDTMKMEPINAPKVRLEVDEK